MKEKIIGIKCYCGKTVFFNEEETDSEKDIVKCECGKEYMPKYKGATETPVVLIQTEFGGSWRDYEGDFIKKTVTGEKTSNKEKEIIYATLVNSIFPDGNPNLIDSNVIWGTIHEAIEHGKKIQGMKFRKVREKSGNNLVNTANHFKIMVPTLSDLELGR